MNNTISKAANLPYGVKLSFGIGGFGEALPYNLFYVYFLYFLTNVAGVSPALAGTISMISVLWDAVIEPIIGNMSDHCTGRLGRRRTFMGFSIIPLAVVMYLMFMPNTFTGGTQAVYYVAVCMFLWVSHACWCIPFFALGAEITGDYNERNTLRTITMIIEYGVLMLTTSGPMWILAYVTTHGGTPAQSWGYTGMAAGALLLVTLSTCVVGTRGRDHRYSQDMLKEKKESLIKVFRELFQMRAYRILCAMIVIYYIGLAFFMSALVYGMSYLAGMDAGQQALYWIYYSVLMMVILPIVNYFCNRFGKKETILVLMAECVISMAIFFFAGLNSMTAVFVYAFFVATANGAFIAMHMVIAYDCCEIDEFKSGLRREGAIVSIVAFVQKFGSAIGMWSTGIVLALFGYNGASAVQTELAKQGILAVITLIPAAFIVLSFLVFYRYPVTKKKFVLLKDALEKKKAGDIYDTSQFEDLLL